LQPGEQLFLVEGLGDVVVGPGALVNALDIFKQNKINLSWIESFPARLPKAEYVFFVDFEGHVEDPKVKRTLAALQEHSEHLSVLGSFPMALVTD